MISFVLMFILVGFLTSSASGSPASSSGSWPPWPPAGRVLPLPVHPAPGEVSAGGSCSAEQPLTTRSASRRPSRVSTTRPPTAARPSTSPSATSAATSLRPVPAGRRPGDPRQPHAQQDPLGRASLVVQQFAAGGGAQPRREPLRVRAGVPHVPPPHAADVRVRARPDAPPVVAAPVGEVVPGTPARRACPVAHLVPGQARAREQLVGQLVLVGEGRRRPAAATRPA